MNKNESLKRLSVTIDPQLHTDLKIMAAKRGTTVSNIVGDACRDILDKFKKEEAMNAE